MKTLTSILVLLFGLQAATAQPLQRVAPEQAGLDSRKLMYACLLYTSDAADE